MVTEGSCSPCEGHRLAEHNLDKLLWINTVGICQFSPHEICTTIANQCPLNSVTDMRCTPSGNLVKLHIFLVYFSTEFISAWVVTITLWSFQTCYQSFFDGYHLIYHRLIVFGCIHLQCIANRSFLQAVVWVLFNSSWGVPLKC